MNTVKNNNNCIRTLFITRPGSGHFNGVAPVARKMIEKGHPVLLVVAPCSEKFCSVDKNIDISIIDISNEQRDEIDSELIERKDEFLKSTYYTKSLIRDEPLYGPSRWPLEARYIAPKLMEIAKNWGAQLIVRDTADLSGWVVAQALDIPFASIEVGQFRCFESDTWELLSGEDARYLQNLMKLKEISGFSSLYKYLDLSFAPNSWQSLDLKQLTTRHVFQPSLYDIPTEEERKALPKFPQVQSTIFVSLGTEFNSDTNMIELLLNALSSAPINVILSIGKNMNIEAWNIQSESIYITRYIQTAQILPICDAFIHHGGTNSIAALYFGLPSVVIPMGADQYGTAERLHSMGVGIALTEKEDRNADNIYRSIMDVLEKPKYKQRALEVQKEITNLPKIDDAITLLECLAKTGKPVLNNNSQFRAAITD